MSAPGRPDGPDIMSTESFCAIQGSAQRETDPSLRGVLHHRAIGLRRDCPSHSELRSAHPQLFVGNSSFSRNSDMGDVSPLSSYTRPVEHMDEPTGAAMNLGVSACPPRSVISREEPIRCPYGKTHAALSSLTVSVFMDVC